MSMSEKKGNPIPQGNMFRHYDLEALSILLE